MLFGLVCQNVFGTDCNILVLTIILLKLHLKIKQVSLIPSNGLFTLSYQIKKG
jgi:uncharacterized membrane protein